eukprot:1182707-Prorocentrum_minimum.AAC.2
MPLDGCTPMYIAAQQGHVEVVQTLLFGCRNEAVPDALVRDIDVNFARKNGVAPLYMASQKGHWEVVQLLMKHPRIDINAADNVSRAPPHPLHPSIHTPSPPAHHSPSTPPLQPLYTPSAFHPLLFVTASSSTAGLARPAPHPAPHN